MKLYHLLILYLFTISAYSQSLADAGPTERYVFSEATLYVYNYDTSVEVFRKTVSDTTSFSQVKELPFPLQPVFLTADIHSGVLSVCKLLNNKKEYSVEEDGMLLIQAKGYDESPDSEEDGDDLVFPYGLSPLYTLDITGNTATFTFVEPYGNSLYGFPLKGKFIITMVKE